MRMKCLSLFANVGIGEAYFDRLGVDVVVANELLKGRAEFYSHLYPETKMICGDITSEEVQTDLAESCMGHDIDLILATPPCQGMSIANAKRSDKKDPRNSLIKHAINMVEKIEPKYVLIENVPGMKSEKTFILDEHGESVNILPYIKSRVGDKYVISHQVLNASDYGTPHHRKRLITLLSRRDCEEWLHPKPLTRRITVRQAIGHLPSIESGEGSGIKWHSMEHKIHNDRHLEWMKHTPTGKTAFDNPEHYPRVLDYEETKGPCWQMRKIKGFKTTYKRMSWDEPAPTVTMMNGSINSQNNCHPGKVKSDGTYSDARVLTIKEIVRIVGLPDNWVDDLEHTKPKESFLRHVLGECFPPMMSASIVKNIPCLK